MRGAFSIEAEGNAAVSVFVGGFIAGPGFAWGNGGGVSRGDGDLVELGTDRGDAPQVARRLFKEAVRNRENRKREGGGTFWWSFVASASDS